MREGRVVAGPRARQRPHLQELQRHVRLAGADLVVRQAEAQAEDLGFLLTCRVGSSWLATVLLLLSCRLCMMHWEK